MNTITTAQAAEILNCSTSTVGRMCQDGHLVAHKIGQAWAIDEAHCRKLAERYEPTKRPINLNTASFSKPVGKAANKVQLGQRVKFDPTEAGAELRRTSNGKEYWYIPNRIER